ncbi:hypothetical protein A2917_00530 [Candidatus Nomurabacteria bacterium RIFCSPLOWO2_01_FULL_42_17]|uniref:Uncharacterized protein n=1 Tax=Candidatus Nomurabacteria bacterium RIFCSPLOWO2_01_FULL_42_17 TaxID=1801780 RepID=A0A1F6XNS6_9BACT|nr:MAG: hypothetical protein A2917_00530 [Candidatus Nomurabacteria bacterium RIFCSPLOWO2_01_FULL_42_17]
MNINKAQIIVVVLGILIVAGGIFSYNKSTDSFKEIFSKVSAELASKEFIRERVDGIFTVKDDELSALNNLPAGVYPKIHFSLDQVVSTDAGILLGGTKPYLSNIRILLEDFANDPVLFAAEVISMPKDMLLYVKLNELSGFPMDLSSIKGKWWRMDLKALVKNLGGTESDDILKAVEQGGIPNVSKEERQEQLAIVEKYENAARIKKLGDGQIEGSPSYRFSITLEKTELKNMLTELLGVIVKNAGEGQKVDALEIAAGIEDALQMIDIHNIELLVHKENYLPIQVKSSIEISDETGKNTGTMDLSVIIDGASPVEIKAPANSTDFMYLFSNLMTGMEIK